MSKSSDNGKSWMVLGCFRQDEHKVYFISNGSTEEYLTYDFSDDMECRIKSDHHVYSLISDSITINTIKKARWGFPHTVPNSTNQQALSDNIYDFVDVIIEDIGSIYSPCFDTLPFSPAGMCGARYYTYLLCVPRETMSFGTIQIMKIVTMNVQLWKILETNKFSFPPTQ